MQFFSISAKIKRKQRSLPYDLSEPLVAAINILQLLYILIVITNTAILEDLVNNERD